MAIQVHSRTQAGMTLEGFGKPDDVAAWLLTLPGNAVLRSTDEVGPCVSAVVWVPHQ